MTPNTSVFAGWVLAATTPLSWCRRRTECCSRGKGSVSTLDPAGRVLLLRCANLRLHFSFLGAQRESDESAHRRSLVVQCGGDAHATSAAVRLFRVGCSDSQRSDPLRFRRCMSSREPSHHLPGSRRRGHDQNSSQA
jgi:hypothetical protein